MAEPINTIQSALNKFAQSIASKWLFDEASVALDAGCDYKVTITCIETPKGYVVAMHRHQTERLGHNSFIKLTHGEWDATDSAHWKEKQRPSELDRAMSGRQE